MQQREFVSGFSELKDLLIRTYGIERDRAFVKLYFNENDNTLLMHDYHDHSKAIVLSQNISKKEIREGLVGNSYNLIEESLLQLKPSGFLNEGFELNGFFIS